MITEFQYQQMLAATERNAGRVPKSDTVPVEQESELQDAVVQLCRENGWYCERSRMDKPTRTNVGALDFKIALENGRTAWIETKAKGNKLSPAQNATIAHLKKLGHAAAVCWNMADVLSAIAMAQASEAQAARPRQSEEQPHRAD